MPRRGEALVALVASDLPDDVALPLVDGAVRQTRSNLEDPSLASRRASKTALAVSIRDFDGTQP